ncbi:hypothetical protein QL285_070642 [Trifolium repens]|nr:hypothetical protein QL285_070642 [Trifolium repens]
MNELLKSSWATYGQSSTHVHGGQGSSSAAVPYNPPTRVHNFLDLELELNRPQEEEENQQQYGRGHRQGYPPLCGTGSHRVRPGDGGATLTGSTPGQVAPLGMAPPACASLCLKREDRALVAERSAARKRQKSLLAEVKVENRRTQKLFRKC